MRSAALSSPLPTGTLPRGLNRIQAAGYIGISPRKFDEMVADGRMPQATRIDSRTVWDIRKLDEAFSALDEHETNDWDDDKLPGNTL